LWYHFYWYAHVFGTLHDGVEVEVGYVQSSISGGVSGYSTIDVAFDSGHVYCRCTGWASIVMVMVCYREANTVHFLFEWFECCYDTYVADGSTLWDVVESNCLDGLCAFGSEAVEFVAPTVFPVLSFWPLEEVTIFEGGASERIGNGMGVVCCGRGR
jgi:hypothetical protein